MAEERSKRLVKLLVVSWAFMMVLIASLALLLFLSFRDTSHSLQKTNQKIAELKAIEPIPGHDGKDAVVDYQRIDGVIDQKVTEKVALMPRPKDGKDGRDGKDGKDSTSTTTIIQQPVPGPMGPQGLPAPNQRIPIFDGLGHYQYPGDDEWQPLFQFQEDL